MKLSPDQSTFGLDDLSEQDQDKLAEILDEYMIAYEEGRSPSIESLVAEHPDLEKPLRQYLTGLDLIHEAACPFDHHDSSDVDSARLADFELLDEIGRGAMGIVYSAIDKRSGNPVALKVLAFGSSLKDGLIARFKREAEAARSLRHPNIVPVYDIGSDDGAHFYTMKLIEGESVEELIASARIKRRKNIHDDGLLCSEEEQRYRRIALAIAKVADALHTAHENGLIHRDIKPSNLIADASNNLWITDFGLVRLNQDQGLTKTGDIIGTYRYMSPEQARGRTDLVGPATDVYGLGATLYELLALRPIFRGNDSAKLLRRIDESTPESPRHWEPDVPSQLERIVLQAIHPEVDCRYNTAADLASDLRRFAEGIPVAARRVGFVHNVVRRYAAHRTKILSPAAVLAVGLAGAFLSNLTQNAGPADHKIDSAFRCQFAETKLAELFQNPRIDPSIAAEYEQTIAMLKDNNGSFEQLHWHCRALNQWAMVNIENGNLAESEKLLEEADRLVDGLPNSPATNAVKALAAANRAMIHASRERFDECMNSSQQIERLLSDDNSPIDDNLLTQIVLGLERVSDSLKAEPLADDAAVIMQRSLTLLSQSNSKSLNLRQAEAVVLSNLGSLQFDRRQNALSKETLRSAIDLFERLSAEHPLSEQLRINLAVALNNLGQVYASESSNKLAERSFLRAWNRIEPLCGIACKNPTLLNSASGILNNLGVLYRVRRDDKAAESAFSQSKSLLDRAMRFEQTNVQFPGNMVRVLHNKSDPFSDESSSNLRGL